MSITIEGQRRRLALKPDPLGVPRNPLAIYLLLIALTTGVVTLLGGVVANSISLELHPVAQRIWGALLTLGASATLGGMYWQGRASTGLLLKRVGVFTLLIASLTYAVVMLVAFGLKGLTTAAVMAGFSVACAVQYHALNQRVKVIILESLDPGLIGRALTPASGSERNEAP